MSDNTVYGSCEGPEAMYVKLVSSDGHEFIIKRETALTSGTIKAMLSGPGQFEENETNVVNFREIPSHVLQKVAHYFMYKVRFTNSSTEIPEFPIAPEVPVMKITSRLQFAISQILQRRGTGFLEGAVDLKRSAKSVERKFSKMMLNTVGLTVVNKYPNALESFASTIIKRPKKLKASMTSSNQAKIYANVLMQHVQEVIQSGELCELAANLNVTINKAELDSKFVELKLYWNAKDAPEDRSTQQILDRLAPKLKETVSQMNIVGRAPRVTFIANYTQHDMDILNEKFEQLDLPENYKPVFDRNLFPSKKFADTTLSLKSDYEMQIIEEERAKS